MGGRFCFDGANWKELEQPSHAGTALLMFEHVYVLYVLYVEFFLFPCKSVM